MKPISFLYLSQEDVAATGMTVGDAIPLVEESFRAHGNGDSENPPKPGIHPLSDAFIHAMPGYLPKLGAAGMKWVSGFPGNYRHQLPSVMGFIIINDVETGQPLAIMEGGWLTAIRTAAVSAVAAKTLARSGAEVVGLVGAGVQGRVHSLAMGKALPQLKTLRVFDARSEQIDQFIESISSKVPFRVERADSAREAIEGADVAITATGRLTRPIFHREWLREGALVLPVHTRGWDKDITFELDKFVVDCWEQFRGVQGYPGAYYESLPEPHAQLGEILVGKKPGRENDQQQIINHNYGMAIHDVIMGRHVLERATAMGLGTKLPLMRGTPDFS